MLARITRVSSSMAVRNAASRSFVSRTAVKAAGGHGDHGDHGHHDHRMFENLPFSKKSIGILVFGGLFAGVGLCALASFHQQRKQGFLK